MKNKKRLLWGSLLILLGASPACSGIRSALCTFDGTVPTCSGCTVSYGPNPTTAIGTVSSMVKTYQWAEIRTDFGTSQEKIFKVAVPKNGVQFSNVLSPFPVPKPASATMFLCLKFLTAPPVCDQAFGNFTVP